MNDDDTILQTLLQGVVDWADWAISFIIDLPPDCALDRHGRSARLRCVACAAGCLEVRLLSHWMEPAAAPVEDGEECA